MFQDTKKFSKEIAALKASGTFESDSLHPLIKDSIKQRVLKSIFAQTADAPKSFVWQEKKTWLIKYIVSPLLGFSLLAGTALAANNSKPGDVLFPVKKAEEKIAISLATSDQAKASLEVKFANRRLEEFKQIREQIKTDVSANAGNATSTISGRAGSTNSKNHLEFHAKAEAEAQAEVSNAINALTQVRLNLSSKNNQQAASSVENTLLKLRDTKNSFNNKGHSGDTRPQTDNGDNNNQNNSSGNQNIHKNLNLELINNSVNGHKNINLRDNISGN